jgi:hypothetical protein
MGLRTLVCQGWFVVLLSGIAAGCGTAVYEPPIGEFSKGFASANEIVSDRARAMDSVKMRKAIESEFYKDEDPNKVDRQKLLAFTTAVCATSDYLRKQRSSLATLKIYNEMLVTTNTKPKQEVIALGKSIIANWNEAPALKPTDAAARTALKCSQEVQNLITFARADVPEFAPLAALSAIEAAQAMYKALEKATIAILSMTDDAVRGSKIKAYVLASKETTDGALATLNERDAGVDLICKRLNYQPPCNAESTPPTALDGVTIAQKWASLRKPWHLYLAMYSSRSAYEDTVKGKAPNAVDPAPYWYLIDKQLDDLNEALHDYRALASLPSSGDVARSMANANQTLVRLANGELTPGEAWAILQDYAGRLKEIGEDLKNLNDAKGSFATKLKDLNSAAGQAKP